MTVLNGGSSSGKSSIARELQAILDRSYLVFSIDTLVDALPPSGGLTLTADVTADDEFRRLEHAWYAGLAAMARDGAGLIVDDVFLGGVRSQARLADALEGLAVTWVGVHCAAEVATARETTRADRPTGMAARQATAVHEGVHYDLTVDTTTATAADCARIISEYLANV